MLNIGIDVDNTICDFMYSYLERFGTPKNDYEITRNVFRVLRNDKDFWLNLPLINKPDFIPTLYCTKRINPKSWTKQYLEQNGLPNSPVYQVYYQYGSKANFIKGKVDVFIEDSVSNFIDLNSKGIPCLLIDSEYNQDWGPVGRIFSLDKNEIEEAYHLLMHTVFPEWK